VIPGRLRLVWDGLANPMNPTATIQRLVSEHPNIARVRVNQLAGSLLLEHVHGIWWRRSQVQKLLDTAASEAATQSSLSRSQSHPNQGPLVRLQGAVLLLLGHWLLADIWLVFLLVVLLPPLLLPMLLGLRHRIKRNGLPADALDLVWFGTLILRRKWGGLATELAMDNASKVLQGKINQSPSNGEGIRKEFLSRLQQRLFPLQPPQGGEKLLRDLCGGDQILLRQGDIVPLEGMVVSGSGWVSQRLLDGDITLVAVQGLQRLPFGVELVEGEIVFQLTQELAQQPIYQDLSHHDAPQGALWGIERARILHQQLIPVVLGAGLSALAIGQVNAAASLMQFDPFRDWQVSASVAYRAACQLLEGWGVLLRRGMVLDRLAECRTLVISEGAVWHSKNRLLLEIRSLVEGFDDNLLLQIAVGLRQHGPLEAIPLDALHSILQNMGLQPCAVENLKPCLDVGIEGLWMGQRVGLGGELLLSQLGIARPDSMPSMAGMHWVFVLVGTEVVGGLLFQDQLDPGVRRSLRWLRRNGWQVHLVSNGVGDTVDWLIGTLKLSPEAVHTALDFSQRQELLCNFDRREGPVAYLGSSLVDAGALVTADIALAMADGSLALSSELADLVLPAKRLDRLVDCVAVAEDIGANNRQNLYLILVPHSAALLLSVLLLLDPLLAILLADVPLVLAELHNLHTYSHLQQHHRLGWRALRKRKAKHRHATHPALAEPINPTGDRPRGRAKDLR
jgi:cation transport ATPase